MIKESEEITLNQLMIFSGESGLGKSYLSIICHYLFAVLLDEKRISKFFENQGFQFAEYRKNFHGAGTAISFPKDDFEQWLAKDAITWLAYMIKDDGVQADIIIKLPDNIPDIIDMTFEEEISELGNNVETYINLSLPGLTYKIKESMGINEESPFATLLRAYLIQQIFGNFRNLKDSYIFPPSRGTMLTENIETVMGMYTEFKRGLQRMNAAKPNKVEMPKQLKELFFQILDGHVSREEGKYLYETGDMVLPISAAAASIRELAPIQMLIESTDISKSAVMIDEPEAHLHPLKQRMIADIISSMVMAGAHVQLTTHSDYFLRRLNELVLKYQIFHKSFINQDDKYEQMCNELRLNPNRTINPDLISAYLLQRNESDPSSSHVVKQDMENGVPFSAFHDAINDSLKMKYELEKRLTYETD